jgi:hypothetical protein
MNLNWLRNLLGETPPCETCEVLKQELALAHNQNEKLLNSIITKPEPIELAREIPEAILPKFKPWRLKKMELERADRLKAEELKSAFAKTEVEDLESLLEIEDAPK